MNVVSIHRENAAARSLVVPRHAVVNGSLGVGNLGDETLLHTLQQTHAAEYSVWSAITDNTESPCDGLQLVSQPRFAMGRLPMRGLVSRISSRRQIEGYASGIKRDYVWIGGLFGHPFHIRWRAKEARWASSFCDRVVYYFGDAEYGPDASASANQLCQELNNISTWIAVRAPRAAERLADSGYRGDIHVGMDIVFFDRFTRRGVPALPTRASAIVINPVEHKMTELREVWLAAARSAVRLGLAIRWVSFCDPDDLRACADLSRQIEREFPGCAQAVFSTKDAEQALHDASACLATRYHTAIFAITSGIPTAGVSYSPKVAELFERFGLNDSLCHETSPDAWGATWRNLIDGEIGHPDWRIVRHAADDHRRALNLFEESFQ